MKIHKICGEHHYESIILVIKKKYTTKYDKPTKEKEKKEEEEEGRERRASRNQTAVPRARSRDSTEGSHPPKAGSPTARNQSQN